jgi:hypothetical protein
MRLGACAFGAFDPANVLRFLFVSSQPPVGTVVSTVLDAATNRLNVSATLTPTVDAQLDALLEAVTGVGPGKSLANKVTLIQGYGDAGDSEAACAALTGFEVNVQTDKKITKTQAGCVHQSGWLFRPQRECVDAAGNGEALAQTEP